MGTDDINVQEARVTYSTKELLRDIHSRLDRIDNAVSNIPTRAEMDHMEKRLVHVETWKIQQEAVRVDRSVQFGKREKAISAGIAVTLLILQILTITHVI